MKPFKAGYFLSIAISLATAGMLAQALPMEDIARMVSEGKAKRSLRYRFESVEQDNVLKDAKVPTLKTCLTLMSTTINGFTVLLEADNVATIGTDDYNSVMNDDQHFASYSVVTDPVGTEINQAWVKYAVSDSFSTTFGRQRILHGGQPRRRSGLAPE